MLSIFPDLIRFGRRLRQQYGWRLTLLSGLVSALLLAPYMTVVQGRSVDQVTVSFPDQTQAQAATPSRYGAAAVVGETLEPCETERVQPTARVLTPSSAWQDALKKAQPGSIFLLRSGLYQASAPLTIAAGQLNRPVVIKPYNCEAVTLRGGLLLLSYTTIAGLRIEGADPTKTGPSYVIRADGRKQALRTLIIRNNTIWGGEIDAIRLNDDVVDVQVTGNQIDGGKTGHDLFVTTETKPIVVTKSPDKLLISNNRLTKVYFRKLAVASEDMFQVRNARAIQFLSNSCENGSRMEQCVDIKDMSTPIVIQANLFNGTTLQQDGPGEDASSGCMVIHEFDGHPEAHLIEGNYFKHCRTTVIRFASEGGTANSSGTVRYNLFLNPTSTDEDALLIWRSENVTFEYNTMIQGTLKLGRGNGLEQNPPITPKNTVLKNNLFYKTRIDDNTRSPDFVYQCHRNLFFQISQRGNRTLQCTTSLTSDPKLTLLAAEDYRPASTSPACKASEAGTPVGALPCQPATARILSSEEVITWYDAVTNPGLVETAAVDTGEVYDVVEEAELTVDTVVDEAPVAAIDNPPPTDTAVITDGVYAEPLSSGLRYRSYLPLIER